MRKKKGEALAGLKMGHGICSSGIDHVSREEGKEERGLNPTTALGFVRSVQHTHTHTFLIHSHL